MQSEDVMLLDNSELQLIYWLLVDAYSASRVLEGHTCGIVPKACELCIINDKSS